MERKRLPKGIQVFRDIRNRGYYYVDKTIYINQLLQEDNTNIFLSRPRRFGKSLFVDTLREAFGGNEELFRGLALHDKWDWSRRYPVIHLDFSAGEYLGKFDLQETMDMMLDETERQTGVTTKPRKPVLRLRELIGKLHRQTGQRVVLLVDEYDKPILDAIEKPKIAAANRNRLREIYGVTKSAAAKIHFSFFTGASRFAKTSLFSGANNFEDITIEPKYSSICGYTEADLDKVFAPELDELNREEIREWYNGYSWLGEESVYNPYDILYLFSKREYQPWWFRTGSPSFLVKTMKNKKAVSLDLDQPIARSELLESFDIESIDPKTLLFQAGYLTIAEKVKIGSRTEYMLDYPNREVRENLNNLFLEMLLPGAAEALLEGHEKLLGILAACDVEGMRTLFQKVCAGLPKQWHSPVNLTQYEAYFASAFYSYFMGAGLMVRAEEATSRGRVDLAVTGPSYVYLFEFKMVNGKKRGMAIKQMRDMEYVQKYRGTDKPVYLAGMEFSKSKHGITGFEVVKDDGGSR